MTGPGPPLDPKLRLFIRVAKLLIYGDWLIWTDTGEDPTLAIYTGDYELRKLEVQWTRDVSGAPLDDRAICTFHLLNLTAGAPDPTWITGDFTAIEARFDTWWTAIKTLYEPRVKLVEYVWRRDGPSFKPHGAEFSPVVRRVARSVAGTGGGAVSMLPPQVALTVTERTAAKFTAEDVEGVGDQLRNRWGRFYLPNVAGDQVVDGRPATACRTTVATATGVLYNGLRTDQFIPVMYSPTTGNSWSVDEIAVDDIFDVQRSRRWRNVINRSVVATAS